MRLQKLPHSIIHPRNPNRHGGKGLSFWSRPLDQRDDLEQTKAKRIARKLARPARSKSTLAPVAPEKKIIPIATAPMTPDQALDFVRRKVDEASSIVGTQVDICLGFVYVATNPAWPDHVKIGSALDYEVRLAQYQTGSPHRDYRLEYVLLFDDRIAAERAAHSALAPYRVGDTEWFEMKISTAIEVIYSLKSRVGS